ncbi:MAG: glycogen synthase [Proteobacteria bacterium]|nr:glycogen synthase [Pseudomonadota bacterium]
MRVLFLAAEAAPWVKVGGLADVAGALPAALRRLDIDVRLMLPRYGTIHPGQVGLTKILDNFPTPLEWRGEESQVWGCDEGRTLFVENHHFFGSRGRVYGEGDDAERFVLFCRAALQACHRAGWMPDVVHAHDWHAAAAVRIAWAAPMRPGLVFTIHNIAHQGLFGPSKWPLIGVYDAHGPVNLMEQALRTADVITTVSPTYADEIRRPEYGLGLDGVLRERHGRLVGVLNGIDTDDYNPMTDRRIAARFSVDGLDGKAACKRELQAAMGLPQRPDVPLIGVVTRLDPQKGIDLIVKSFHEILHYSDAQMVLLGSGADSYEHSIRMAAAGNPSRIACHIGFNADLARRIYAGSDMFLMPSSFEPCGLAQMISMRYGTLPIARATGGLVDTITDRGGGSGTGYLFGRYSKDEMLGAIGRALGDYRHRESWQQAMRRAMLTDVSWERSARVYADIYRWAASVR